MKKSKSERVVEFVILVGLILFAPLLAAPAVLERGFFRNALDQRHAVVDAAL